MTTLVAGADLGGTTVSIALAECDGTIVAEAKIPTNSHEGPVRCSLLLHRLDARPLRSVWECPVWSI
jgi:predicted NBD/HSP70 family sugar kinase